MNVLGRTYEDSGEVLKYTGGKQAFSQEKKKTVLLIITEVDECQCRLVWASRILL